MGAVAYLAQGFAVGTTYCYSFEIKGDGTGGNHKLYRYHMSNGIRQAMTNNGVGGLAHANDMALVGYGGKTYMYVVACSYNKTGTADTGTNSYIVKLEYNSSGQYWVDKKYEVNVPLAGIAYVDGVNAGFCFLHGRNAAASFYARRPLPLFMKKL